MIDNKNEELPMDWWKFWKYFMFPVGILVSISSIMQYSNIDFAILNFLGWLIVIANIIIFTLLCVTYGMFLAKKKQAYNVFITYLFLYPAWNTFVITCNNIFSNAFANDISNNITRLVITGLISYGIICGIWIYPNYIYFKKRKDFFDKKEQKQQRTNQEQENGQLKYLIDNIQKKQNIDIEVKENYIQNKVKNNKKYCTKCGKNIDNEWIFCNYCGNKIK